jgi:hypothetical protein
VDTTADAYLYAGVRMKTQSLVARLIAILTGEGVREDAVAGPDLPKRVSVDEVYRELGDNYRYHLGWRARLLGGFVAVSGALAFAYDKVVSSSFGWLLPLAGFVFSMAAFYLEERCHDILRHRAKVGEALERRAGHEGTYCSAETMGWGRRPSHTDTLRALYLLGALFFAIWTAVGAKVWATACDKAKVPGRILHDFRRTAVRNLERAGVPRSVAMKLTGHKTESVYRRYAIVSDADLREATQRLMGTFSGPLGAPRVDARVVSVQNDGREALAQPGRAPAF